MMSASDTREQASKTNKGDKKTPIGKYALGKPRPSKKYGTFIPIGYPNAEDKKKGYTGSAIGIHGPKRGFTWARSLNTMFDWTLGCIAVGTDSEVEEISAWIKKYRVEKITLTN